MIYNILITLGVIAIVIYLVKFSGRGAVFVIKIEDGEVSVEKGTPPAEFVEDCEHIVKDANLTAGKVIGEPGAEGTRLKLSAGIPPELHQRFRNAWGVHQR